MVQTKPITVKLQLVQVIDVNKETGQEEDYFYLELLQSRPDDRVNFQCVQIDPSMYAQLKRGLRLEDE